jgi:hypothetical protein
MRFDPVSSGATAGWAQFLDHNFFIYTFFIKIFTKYFFVSKIYKSIAKAAGT